MNKKSVATCLCLLAMSHAAPSFAQTPDGQGTAYVNPCSTAPITDFDFWVGDWVAFDYDTGVVQGIDRIQKTNNGCVLHPGLEAVDRTPFEPKAPTIVTPACPSIRCCRMGNGNKFGSATTVVQSLFTAD